MTTSIVPSRRRRPRAARRPTTAPGLATVPGTPPVAAPSLDLPAVAAPSLNLPPVAAPSSGIPAATFADLPLEPRLVEALGRRGLTVPFPIQAAALPDALAGRDVLGRGRTGSGKTLAFGLPVLSRLAGRRAAARRPLALVLVPTRELAQQVTEALQPYAEVLRLRCTTAVGGLSIRAQATALSRGAEVLVATPGRLADLVQQGFCRLDQVDIAVVDEADQMSDIGFLPQVTRLLDQVPAGGQRMLFSATLDAAVDKLVRRFLTAPVTHSVDPPAATVTTMTHRLREVSVDDKADTVADLAASNPRTMMFVATKRGADRLARRLADTGLRVLAIHGGKSQGQRTRALEQFRAGAVQVLVATNVAARGIHVDDLDLVVNVDPPADGKDYLHRGGRTARAGRTGTVVTLVLPEQRRDVHRLMTAAGIRPERSTATLPAARAAVGRPAAQAPVGRPAARSGRPRHHRSGAA